MHPFFLTANSIFISWSCHHHGVKDGCLKVELPLCTCSSSSSFLVLCQRFLEPWFGPSRSGCQLDPAGKKVPRLMSSDCERWPVMRGDNGAQTGLHATTRLKPLGCEQGAGGWKARRRPENERLRCCDPRPLLRIDSDNKFSFGGQY